MTDRFNKFMAELSDLTNKYGIEIGGCGCCGSPFVTGSDGRYYGDNLQYDTLTKQYKLEECELPLPDPPKMWEKENPCTPSGGNPCTPSVNLNGNIFYQYISNGGTPQGMGMILGAALKGMEND